MGSEEERLLFRLETCASSALRHLIQSGPIGADRWLADGGSWEFEPVPKTAAGALPTAAPEGSEGRRRQMVAFLEKSELEGAQTLRYVMATDDV